MVQRRGPRLTAAQKTELWRRWRRGESLNAIGRALGRIAKVVRYEVARQRSRLALTLSEREAISRGLPSGTSVRQISRQLLRAPSTVSREVRRHGGRRPKRCRLARHPALRDAVATQLAHAWSPQQIAGWLRQAYPDDPTMHVSHKTIYLSLFIQSRGVLKKALQAQLRQRHTIRRPSTAARKAGGYIVGAVSIRERPATVEDRAVPGHWEGDLLVGGRHSYVATLVERRSRYVCLVRLTGKDTQTVVQALTQHVLKRPRFSWTRIKGESNVQGGGGNGSIEGRGTGRGIGADGGSPKGDWSPCRRGGGRGGLLGAGAAVERQPEARRGAAAAAWRIAGGAVP